MFLQPGQLTEKKNPQQTSSPESLSISCRLFAAQFMFSMVDSRDHPALFKTRLSSQLLCHCVRYVANSFDPSRTTMKGSW